ncbi:MAG: TonB-dependent receptor [Acidobacteriota bacterium]
MRARHTAFLTVLLALPASAQSTTASLSGIVHDPTGLPLGAASVTATRSTTQTSTVAGTDSAGLYHFVALPPGAYRITIAKPDFATLQRDGVVLTVGEETRVDVELPLARTTQSVDVTADAPLLEATRGAVSFAVDQKKVAAFPLDGRNFVPLLALSPGVNLPPGSTLPRFNGSRPRTSEYIYDGVSVLQPEPGQVAFYPIIDAIQEFRVETNSYSAEYGRSNGGVIMVNQRSGSNNLHASLFEFFRNEKWNARNLFATTGSKPRFRRNQYGFVLGGPVQKNRTFFFVDGQGTRLNTGIIRTSTVPTAAQRQGVFSTPIYDPSTARASAFSGNIIPIARFDPAALALLARYPLPTASGAANNYRRVANENTAQDQFDVRLDRYFGARHRVFGRYSYLRDDSSPVTPLPDGSGNVTSGIIGNTFTRADGLALEHTWTATPALVNQLRFGYTRRAFDRNALPIPIYDVTGFQQLGPSVSSIGIFGTSVTQFLDNMSVLLGHGHTVKVGVDIRLEHLNARQPPLPNGNFQFTSVFTAGLTPQGAPVANTGNAFASFLLGQVTRYTLDVQPGILRPRATIAEFFAQDDWRVTPRLSVNAGLRYTLNFPSTVAGDHGAVFNLQTQKLDFLGKNGFPRAARNLDKTNFGPRLGLAYKITESFVIRAGYGLTWIEQAGITTPFTTPLYPFIQNLTQQSANNITPAFTLAQGPSVQPRPLTPDAGVGQNVYAVQRGNGSGYAQQWNLSLQKTFGESWSFEAGYLGSKLTRLGVPDVNLNQLTLQQLTDQSKGAPQAARPYPNFNIVALYRNNVGHSTYHSLQARAEKRFTRSLTFNLSYTFSRLIDDAGAVFDSAIPSGPVAAYNAADSYNRRLEKDVSTGNVPHIISAGFVYDIPFAHGWQLSGIARAQSGSPLSVIQATNLNAFAGFGIQRPNRLADPALPPDQRTAARWFNTQAFSPASQFTIGNSSRNPVTGPGYRTLDLMIGKTFTFADRYRAEFRAEAFNVTNTPPLGNPNVSQGNAAFGSITSAFDPRVFEGVVKVHF